MFWPRIVSTARARAGANLAYRAALRINSSTQPKMGGLRFAHATLGPDAANPTKVTQPLKTSTGEVLRVSISETAVSKLNELREKDNRPDMHLRVRVESGGCHGFQYIFDLEDIQEIGKNDSIFSRDGAKVVIDHDSLSILRDSTVDYSTELIGSQFKVTSPHTSSACGCGSSFSIDP